MKTIANKQEFYVKNLKGKNDWREREFTIISEGYNEFCRIVL